MEQNTQQFFDRPRIRTALFISAILIGVIYFFQITSSSARGFELRHLSERKTQLLGETSRLDFNIAEESSAQNLKKRLDALGLAAATKMEYVHADSHSVAVR